MRKIIKKGDIFLLVLFLLSAVLIACIPVLRQSSSPTSSLSDDGSGASDEGNSSRTSELTGAGSDSVVITIAGDVYGTWPLSEDRTITINNDYGMNEVTISGGSVSVTKSDCSNQICVDTGKIRSPGQMIVCLPHRLIVEIKTNESSSGQEEYDAIVH